MKRTISAGALSLALVLFGTQAATAQESIPDAPRPRTALPNIPSVAPASATPDAPTPTQAATQAGASQDSQPAATPGDTTTEVPAAGHGVETALSLEKTYRLPNVRVNLVQVPFTVKDSKGNLISGLTPHDVRIYENGQPQNMREFMTDPFPLSVALVIDQSMAFNDMDKVNAALTALQGAFASYDEIAIFTYNNGPQKRTDFTGAQSDRVPMVLQTSRSAGRDGLFANTSGPLSQNINKNGGTELNWDPNENSSHGRSMSNVQNVPKEVHTLNDAILAAAKELTRVGRGRRRIIYVISNGNEYGSTAKTKDVVTYLQHHEITVYGTLVHDIPNLHIPFTGFVDRLHLPFQMRDNILPLYANATGGEIDPEITSRGIQNSFARIAETARLQYTVYYTSSESKYDGKYRSIDVRVLGRPGLTIIAKPGYFPTADNAPATADPTPPASAK